MCVIAGSIHLCVTSMFSSRFFYCLKHIKYTICHHNNTIKTNGLNSNIRAIIYLCNVTGFSFRLKFCLMHCIGFFISRGLVIFSV